MKKITGTTTVLAAALLTLGITAVTQAALLTPVSVTGSGSFINIQYIDDGVFPNESGYWKTNTTYWYGTASAFVFDYGDIVTIDDITLSVDNNDSYQVDYSTDNSTWNTLFTISSSIGEIGWGMDTMSTLSTNPEYQASIDFASVDARYLRIAAIGGDYAYAVGEFQVDGSAGPAPVPEPATMFLFGTGLAGLVGARRRKN